MPRALASSAAESTPGTGRTAPSSDSSPISNADSWIGSDTSFSERATIATATGRSSDAPALRMSAGARLTVMRR